jgi:outer membrane protein assembly factor BamD
MKQTLRPRSVPLAAVGLVAVMMASGCTGGGRRDPILELAAEESLVQGKALMEQKKYSRARPYLSHAFEVEPNSVSGREALLLVADSYYLDGGVSNYIQAEAKYRDYLNRFPTSDQASYAQFQIANSLAKRIERPDRDQTPTVKALAAYQELIRLYPSSEYAEQVEEQLHLVEENLAAHELVVGRFNLRYRNYAGAIERLEHLVEAYPRYSELDRALFLLGTAYRHSRNVLHRIRARETFEQLRAEFPESRYVAKIPEVPDLKPEQNDTSAGSPPPEPPQEDPS